MRFLFNEYYRHDKGFTDEDMMSIIKIPTKKDYHDFFRKYVDGTEVPDYDTIFGYAGYKLNKEKGQDPFFGFNARFRNNGITINAVTPNSPAEAAGLLAGDVIEKIDGESAQQVKFQDLAGKTIKLAVNRDGAPMEIQMKVGSREVTHYQLSELPNPTAKQLRIREAWLKR